jgi:hypothetical protein
MPENSTREVMLEHTWRYFELHANQRMSVFNFFLVMSGALAAGIAASLQGSPNLAAVGVVLGVLLSLVSFVFWKLDQRVSFLIKHAETALAEMESSLLTERARLFSLEPMSTAAAGSKSNLWVRHWSYGESFRVIFAVMAVFGVCSALLSALKFVGLILCQTP